MIKQQKLIGAPGHVFPIAQCFHWWGSRRVFLSKSVRITVQRTHDTHDAYCTVIIAFIEWCTVHCDQCIYQVVKLYLLAIESRSIYRRCIDVVYLIRCIIHHYHHCHDHAMKCIIHILKKTILLDEMELRVAYNFNCLTIKQI